MSAANDERLATLPVDTPMSAGRLLIAAAPPPAAAEAARVSRARETGPGDS
jgi:hypothetical protein